MMSLGNRIMNYRKELKLTQESLADAIGVSRQTIYKWENDLSTPDSSNLIEMSRLFNVDLSELIDGKGCQTNPTEGINKYPWTKIAIIGLISLVFLTQQIQLAKQKAQLNDLWRELQNISANILVNNNKPSNNNRLLDVQVANVDYGNMEIEFEINLSLQQINKKAKIYILLGDGDKVELTLNDDFEINKSVKLPIENSMTLKFIIEDENDVEVFDIYQYEDMFNSLFYKTSIHATALKGNKREFTMFHSIPTYDFYYHNVHSTIVNGDEFTINDHTFSDFKYNVIDLKGISIQELQASPLDIASNQTLFLEDYDTIINKDEQYYIEVSYIVDGKLLVSYHMGAFTYDLGTLQEGTSDFTFEKIVK